nr:PREDICTED: uncharacterized protein LOC109043532 [Bemisia tabaci]
MKTAKREDGVLGSNETSTKIKDECQNVDRKSSKKMLFKLENLFLNLTKRRLPELSIIFIFGVTTWFFLLLYNTYMLVSAGIYLLQLTPQQAFTRVYSDKIPHDQIIIHAFCNFVCIVHLLLQVLKTKNIRPIIVGIIESELQFPANFNSTFWNSLSAPVLLCTTLALAPIVINRLSLTNTPTPLWRKIQEFMVFIPLSVDLQFYALATSLHQLFVSLNSRLDSLRKRIHVDSSKIVAMKIGRLADNHSLVCDYVEKVSKMYELQMALDVLQIGIFMVINLQQICDSSIRVLDPAWVNVLHGAAWSLHLLSRMYIVTSAPDVAVNHGTRTGVVLALYDDCGVGKVVQEEVNLFLDKTENRNISFTICRAFDLNMGLFAKIILSCIGFTVVLLQFKLAVEVNTELD